MPRKEDDLCCRLISSVWSAFGIIAPLLKKTAARFGPSWEDFSADPDYQQSVAFSILQIGELAGRLSDDLRTETTAEMDWSAIKGLRNIVVHEYGKVKLQVLWDIISEDIPKLKQFCEGHLPEGF